MIANGFSIYELLYHRHWFVLIPKDFNILLFSGIINYLM
jgi:hypothetical protein